LRADEKRSRARAAGASLRHMKKRKREGPQDPMFTAFLRSGWASVLREGGHVSVSYDRADVRPMLPHLLAWTCCRIIMRISAGHAPSVVPPDRYLLRTLARTSRPYRKTPWNGLYRNRRLLFCFVSVVRVSTARHARSHATCTPPTQATPLPMLYYPLRHHAFAKALGGRRRRPLLTPVPW
jgi:hypothetical protein